jgi:transposase-like protein
VKSIVRHRGASRTNNSLERIPREIRRCTRVVGAFPDGQSALNLAAASEARNLHFADTVVRKVEQAAVLLGRCKMLGEV